MLSIIIPTITGREQSLARCWDAYKRTAGERIGVTGFTSADFSVDVEYVVVRDRENWPAACNEGYRQAKGDYLHFTADDLEPLDGWWFKALPHLFDHDELPAPKVFNHSADGEWDNAVDGPDGGTPHFTRIPLMTRSQYERIGPWPEIDYGADVWLSERGRTLGIETRMFHNYAFVHHWEQHGRIDTPERLAASDQRLREFAAQGWPGVE